MTTDTQEVGGDILGTAHHQGRGPKPLAGVRVVDFSHVLAGPFCTRILADLGADVIKVETPQGDLSRRLGDRRGGMSGYYLQQNCGKRNVSIDLKQPEGLELACRLVERCDVLVENFRPGVMQGLGLGADSLRRRNPALIYCSISGFGHDSPHRDQRAFAGIAHATTGILHRQAAMSGTEPQDSVLAVGDTVTGLQAVIAIQAALWLRSRTGQGQFIDLAMHDALLAIQEAANFVLFSGQSADTDFLCAWIYRCGERYVAVPSDPRAHWSDFCALMERPDLLDDPRYDTYAKRVDSLGELEDHISQWVSRQSDAESVVQQLHRRGMAGAKVLTLTEALASEQVRHRAMTVPREDRNGAWVPVLNSPYRFSDAECGVTGRGAFRGEDNREVLTEVLGLDDAELADLEAQGILSARVPTPGR
jgi:CoA:oxalate CoA-transferase